MMFILFGKTYFERSCDHRQRILAHINSWLYGCKHDIGRSVRSRMDLDTFDCGMSNGTGSHYLRCTQVVHN